MSDYTGRFLWYELMTEDVEAAKAFYGEVMGWKAQDWDQADMAYTVFLAGEAQAAGLMVLPEMAKAAGAPPHWLSYVGTSDVDATAAKVTELGGEVLAPPFDVPTVGRIAIIKDPQGAVIGAYTPAAEPPADPEPKTLGLCDWHELGTSDHQAATAFYDGLFGWRKGEAMDMGDGWMYHLFGGTEEKADGGMFTKSAEMPGPPAWLYYFRVDDVASAIARVKGNGGQLLNGPMPVPGGEVVAQCMDPQGAAFAVVGPGE